MVEIVVGSWSVVLAGSCARGTPFRCFQRGPPDHGDCSTDAAVSCSTVDDADGTETMGGSGREQEPEGGGVTGKF